MNKTYLGDGVYAESINGMIKLTTHRFEGEHVIYLEPDVMTALIDFDARARQEATEETK